MIDREKVIKGLQCIIDGTVRCESCGYAIDKHGHHSCQQNCASEAIALLKEQEPAEPKVEALNEIDRLYRCQRCHGYLFYDGQKYCDRCGQEVKWDDI